MTSSPCLILKRNSNWSDADNHAVHCIYQPHLTCSRSLTHPSHPSASHCPPPSTSLYPSLTSSSCLILGRNSWEETGTSQMREIMLCGRARYSHLNGSCSFSPLHTLRPPTPSSLCPSLSPSLTSSPCLILRRRHKNWSDASDLAVHGRHQPYLTGSCSFSSPHTPATPAHSPPPTLL